MSPARPWRRRLQLPVVVWLTIVWVALWGDLSVGTVLTGVVVAVVVCVVFPLPPLGLRLRPHPLWMLWLTTRFVVDLVVASAEVSWKTVIGRQPLNAVIEIDLRTRSDLVLTVVSEMVSLVPGSLVVEARRSTYTIFLHVFDSRDASGADRMRGQVLALERRVARAFGGDALALTPGGPS